MVVFGADWELLGSSDYYVLISNGVSSFSAFCGWSLGCCFLEDGPSCGAFAFSEEVGFFLYRITNLSCEEEFD